MNDDSYKLVFELQGLPPMPNTLLGAPWTVRSAAKRKWFHKVARAVGNRIPRVPLERARLVLTRYSSQEPDDDGLRGSFKPILDSLTVNLGRKKIGPKKWVPIQRGLGVLRDDKPSVIGVPEVHWMKAAPKAGRIRVEVYGLDGRQTHEVDRARRVTEQNGETPHEL